MDDNSRNTVRHVVHVMAGLYLIHTAYGLFKGLPEASGTEKVILIIAIFAFSVIGAVLAVMGVKQGLRDSRTQPEEESEAAIEAGEPDEDEKDL